MLASCGVEKMKIERKRLNNVCVFNANAFLPRLQQRERGECLVMRKVEEVGFTVFLCGVCVCGALFNGQQHTFNGSNQVRYLGDNIIARKNSTNRVNTHNFGCEASRILYR